MGVENKLKYRQWLKTSDHWEGVRQLALILWDCVCQGCGKQDTKNDAHHIFYPEYWNKTGIHHLRILCRGCHKRIHELTNPKDAANLRHAIALYKRGLSIIHDEKNIPGLRRESLLISGRNNRKVYFKKLKAERKERRKERDQARPTETLRWAPFIIRDHLQIVSRVRKPQPSDEEIFFYISQRTVHKSERAYVQIYHEYFIAEGPNFGPQPQQN